MAYEYGNTPEDLRAMQEALESAPSQATPAYAQQLGAYQNALQQNIAALPQNDPQLAGLQSQLAGASAGTVGSGTQVQWEQAPDGSLVQRQVSVPTFTPSEQFKLTGNDPAGIVSSAQPSLDKQISDAQNAETARREQNRIRISGQFEEQIEEQQDIGAKTVGGAEARLGSMRGLGYSSSRETYIEGIRKENQKYIDQLSKAKEDALRQEDFDSADRESARINELRAYDYDLRKLALDEAGQRLAADSAAKEAAEPQTASVGNVLYERQGDGTWKAVTPKPEEGPTFGQGLQMLEMELSLPEGQTFTVPGTDTVITGMRKDTAASAQQLWDKYSSELLSLGLSPSSSLDDAIVKLQPLLKGRLDAESKADLLNVEKIQSEIRENNAQAYKASIDAQKDVLATTIDKSKSLDQINLVRQSIDASRSYAGASGRSGARKSFEAWFIGSTDYTNLVAETNTLRTNVLTLMADPGVKKFFGPQMSNRDVELMTSAGTTLNHELQDPERLLAELDRLEDIVNRAEAAIGSAGQAGMQSEEDELRNTGYSEEQIQQIMNS